VRKISTNKAGKSKSAGSTKGKKVNSEAKAAKAKAAEGTRKRKKDDRKKDASKSASQVVIRHTEPEIPEGLPKKFLTKSTFNTQDIMHSPVEKTLKMIDKILAGERLFTM